MLTHVGALNDVEVASIGSTVEASSDIGDTGLKTFYVSKKYKEALQKELSPWLAKEVKRQGDESNKLLAAARKHKEIFG